MSKIKPCTTCPFRKDKPNWGNLEWLEDVIKGLNLIKKDMGGFQHTCHKTDPKADGYLGHKEGKDSICYGMVAMIKNEMNDCPDSRVTMRLVKREIDWEDIDTSGVYENSKQFILAQLMANGITPNQVLGTQKQSKPTTGK